MRQIREYDKLRNVTETASLDGEHVSSWRHRLKPVIGGSIKIKPVGPEAPEMPVSVWRNTGFLMTGWDGE